MKELRNNDIIDELILQGERLNVLIPTDKYNNIYCNNENDYHKVEYNVI